MTDTVMTPRPSRLVLSWEMPGERLMLIAPPTHATEVVLAFRDAQVSA